MGLFTIMCLNHNDFMEELKFVAALLSNKQTDLDELLRALSGKWRFDEFETSNVRVALLVATVEVFERALSFQGLSDSAKEHIRYAWSLTFLMLESGAYAHYDNYVEQMQYEPCYAYNWDLLARLCTIICKELNIQTALPTTEDLEQFFTTRGRKLE